MCHRYANICEVHVMADLPRLITVMKTLLIFCYTVCYQTEQIIFKLVLIV